ncbi:hypothetical protein LINGRAHAP2_LOCUS15870 [Linum grandiflorum]
MRAIVDGPQLTWSLGIRRIRIQSNSRAAIAILEKDSGLDHQHVTLVLQLKELCSRQRKVHLSHIYREANNAADYLTNILATLSFMGCIFWIHQIGVCPTSYIMILYIFCYLDL